MFAQIRQVVARKPTICASRRLFATNQKGSPNSTSRWLWPVATFAVCGGTFLFVSNISSQRREFFGESLGSSPSEPQAEITSQAYWDVSIDGKPVGRIVLGLHGSVAPKTVRNFEKLCHGTEKDGRLQLSYSGSTFHRIIPSFMIQGGDFENHNGTGGRSIYGGRFDDETFQLKHKAGVLSMANSGPHTNGSQFFVTVKGTPHLNGRHVVFGTVIEGWDIVKEIERCGSSSGRPSANVKIVSCGLLEPVTDE